MNTNVLRKVHRVTAYEAVVYLTLVLVAMFFIWTLNVIAAGAADQITWAVFSITLATLILALIGWVAYNNLGEPVDYIRLDPKKLPLAMGLIILELILGYVNYRLHAYYAGIHAAIPVEKLTAIFLQAASLYVVAIALAENLFFVVALPTFIIKKVLKKPLDQATVVDYIIAAATSGVAAAMFHYAWKPWWALIGTFIHFTIWAFVTLYLRNSILADVTHTAGNVMGLLYSTVYPYYLIYG